MGRGEQVLMHDKKRCSQTPQTNFIIGLSFCLIIVRVKTFGPASFNSIVNRASVGFPGQEAMAISFAVPLDAAGSSSGMAIGDSASQPGIGDGVV
jgi:hypothetical protein